MAVGAAFLVAAGCASTEKSEGTAGTEAAVKSETAAKGQTVKVTLSGDNEVPPVKTKATGSGTIMVGADKSVSGKITTTGVDGTAAHIHDGAPGKNGPVIIPLTKSGHDWTVPLERSSPTSSIRISRPGIFTSTCTARRIKVERFEGI